MLDFVPLTGPRWIVADADRGADLGGQDLEAQFPRPQSRSVAAATVGADQQAVGIAIQTPSIQAPPPSNTLNRELRGVVTDADIDDRTVPRNVVRAVRNRFAVTQMREVV